MSLPQNSAHLMGSTHSPTKWTATLHQTTRLPEFTPISFRAGSERHITPPSSPKPPSPHRSPPPAAPLPFPSKDFHLHFKLVSLVKALSVGRKANCLQHQNHRRVLACFNTRHHGLHGNCQRRWISNHGRLAFWAANFHQTKPSSEL
jgi:hypothetical protein